MPSVADLPSGLATPLANRLIAFPLTANATSRLRARRAAIRRHLAEHSIPWLHVHNMPAPTAAELRLNDIASIKARLGRVSTRLALDTCARQQRRSLCLIVEDDVRFHPRFVLELAQTLHALPRAWRALHLCPEFVWGGSTPNPTPLKLHPSQGRANGKRFYPQWPATRGQWVGGPVAFVVRQSHASAMLERLRGPPPFVGSSVGDSADDSPVEFVRSHPKCRASVRSACVEFVNWTTTCRFMCELEAVDMTLALDHQADEYVAMEPPLCHEQAPRGSSSFANSRFEPTLSSGTPRPTEG